MNSWEDAILDYKIHSEFLTEIYRKFIDGELPFPPLMKKATIKKI